MSGSAGFNQRVFLSLQDQKPGSDAALKSAGTDMGCAAVPRRRLRELIRGTKRNNWCVAGGVWMSDRKGGGYGQIVLNKCSIVKACPPLLYEAPKCAAMSQIRLDSEHDKKARLNSSGSASSSGIAAPPRMGRCVLPRGIEPSVVTVKRPVLSNLDCVHSATDVPCSLSARNSYIGARAAAVAEAHCSSISVPECCH